MIVLVKNSEFKGFIEFDIPNKIYEKMKTLSDLAENLGETTEVIPLTNISSVSLKHIINFVNLNLDPELDNNIPQEEFSEFLAVEKDFINNVNLNDLYSLTKDCDFLNYGRLLHLCLAKFSIILKDLDEDVQRKLLCIEK